MKVVSKYFENVAYLAAYATGRELGLIRDFANRKGVG